MTMEKQPAGSAGREKIGEVKFAFAKATTLRLEYACLVNLFSAASPL